VGKYLLSKTKQWVLGLALLGSGEEAVVAIPTSVRAKTQRIQKDALYNSSALRSAKICRFTPRAERAGFEY